MGDLETERKRGGSPEYVPSGGLVKQTREEKLFENVRMGGRFCDAVW